MTRILLLVVAMLGVEARAEQSPARSAEEAAIRATVLDYVQGWYDGDAARMERALHPELAKRSSGPTPPQGRAGWIRCRQ